jgi:hypothetical protein
MALPQATCGPQVPGTTRPANWADLASMNHLWTTGSLRKSHWHWRFTGAETDKVALVELSASEPPVPTKDGYCFKYIIQGYDTCAQIAKAHDITEADTE